MSIPNETKSKEGCCRPNSALNKERCSDPCYHAYQILRAAFVILPLLAGLDKFFNYTTFWEQYLSAPFDVFGNSATTMMVVGITEIIVGIGVAIMPAIFAYVVAGWLFAIIINLLVLGGFYDIALRDLALLLSAVALGLLASKYCWCCKKKCKEEPPT